MIRHIEKYTPVEWIQLSMISFATRICRSVFFAVYKRRYGEILTESTYNH